MNNDNLLVPAFLGWLRYMIKPEEQTPEVIQGLCKMMQTDHALRHKCVLDLFRDPRVLRIAIIGGIKSDFHKVIERALIDIISNPKRFLNI